jgi:branched-chain amino acid transport system permease protein
MINPRLLSSHPNRLIILRSLAYGVGAILLLTIPLLITNGFVINAILLTLIYVPLVLSVNLITGFTGMLTMGQAAFYGVGAYVSALLMTRLGMPWLVGLLGAGLAAAIFGAVVAIPCLRVGGDYITLMTIGFGVIFSAVATNWTPVTRGSMGIPAVPSASIGSFSFDTLTRQYYLLLAMAALCYFFMYRFTRSHIGRALVAIREDEIAASTLGINLSYYKVLAFVFAALWAGLAGSLFAHYLNFVGPQSFSMDESILILQMAILGGFGSLPGSVIGAAIMIAIPMIFQDIYQYRMLVSGIFLLILMAWRPQAIMGTSAIARTTSIPILNKFKYLFSRKRENEKTPSLPDDRLPGNPIG